MSSTNDEVRSKKRATRGWVDELTGNKWDMGVGPDGWPVAQVPTNVNYGPRMRRCPACKGEHLQTEPLPKACLAVLQARAEAGDPIADKEGDADGHSRKPR